jgi:hypothetical protein
VLIFVLGISEEPRAVDLYLPLLIAVLQPQLHVLRKALALLLGQRRHNGQEHFALGIHRVDVLFFKINGNIFLFELTDVFQAVQRVAGEPADGLGDHHVDVPAMHSSIMRLNSSRFLVLVH